MPIHVHEVNSSVAEIIQRLLNAFWLRKAFLAERTMYMNIGYWEHDPETLDDACEAFIELVGKTGALCKNDVVLDIGCGYCDQDMYWVEHFDVKKIAAVNLSMHQLRIADRRTRERHFDDRIELHFCSAVNLAFQDASFDKVVSVEAAFQFNTRQEFFREALRVLKPNGTFIVTDMLPKDSGQRRRYSSKENHYSCDVYSRKMEEVGFRNVVVRKITRFAARPFHTYLIRRISEKDFQVRISPLFLRYLKWWLPRTNVWNDMDVVIATGEKR